MNAIVDEIFTLFARFGGDGYGEDLSLERHMLQAAAMAESLNAPPHTIVAALLHDIGYFLHTDAAAMVNAGRDFGHETIGAHWLARGFDADVTAPIALHVQAKRYLCAVESDYHDGLSDASRASLAVQGGIMTKAETAAFAVEPGFEAALILRRCDDRGKDVAAAVRPLADYRELLTRTVRA